LEREILNQKNAPVSEIFSQFTFFDRPPTIH